MPEHSEPVVNPFALLTVTARTEGSEQAVGLSFHTGSAPHGASLPEISCYAYEDQAPILIVRQAGTQVTITPAAPRSVGGSDVRFAKELVSCALRYYQALDRVRRNQGANVSTQE